MPLFYHICVALRTPSCSGAQFVVPDFMLTGLVTVLTRSVITLVHVVCDMLAHTGNHLLVTCKGSVCSFCVGECALRACGHWLV